MVTIRTTIKNVKSASTRILNRMHTRHIRVLSRTYYSLWKYINLAYSAVEWTWVYSLISKNLWE